MAAKEPYDYLSIITADYDYTLTIKAQGNITEEGIKNQYLHRGDNNSREAITIFSGSMWFVSWDWAQLSEADAGTVLDLYHDSAKANGIAKTFKWSGHDGHPYVVAFDCDLTRVGRASSAWGFKTVRLELLGRVS